VRFDLAGLVPGGRGHRLRAELGARGSPARPTPSPVHHAAPRARRLGRGHVVVVGRRRRAGLPGDATWLHARYPDVFWGQPGGDFVAALSGSALVGDVGSLCVVQRGMRADVQHWLADPATNFGWLLRGEEVRLAPCAASIRERAPRRPSPHTHRLLIRCPFLTSPTTWGRSRPFIAEVNHDTAHSTHRPARPRRAALARAPARVRSAFPRSAAATTVTIRPRRTTRSTKAPRAPPAMASGSTSSPVAPRTASSAVR
jgi:hypothetical protein